MFDFIVFFSPTPDISWSKVNEDLPSGRFSFHNFQKTLKITEVTEADGGDYRCLTKNRLGSNHHIITVVIRGLSQDVFSSVTSQKSGLVTSFTDPGMPS